MKKDRELAILHQLAKYARTSDRTVAKAVGVSQPTVTRVRNRLEEQGIITGYTPVFNLTKLGFPIVAVSTKKLKETDGVGDVANSEVDHVVHDAEVMTAIKNQYHTALTILSAHKDFTAYVTFLKKHRITDSAPTVTSNILKTFSLEGFVTSEE